MKDNLLYWLWLQECLGPNARVKELLGRYESPEAFYNAGEIFWNSENFSELVFDKLRSYTPCEFADRVEFCAEHKVHIITPDSEYYPEALLEIENYPLALYVRGDYRILNGKKIIAVIGSRTPCVYGERAAVKIVSRLVESDYVIVSGGALGIDSIAHKTAVESGGKTILVMGCGHGYNYLPENASLRKIVANNGALVTEYPPMSSVTRSSFPERNRIISALGKGVVIVEAAERSGTFNTATHAKKQKKDLFVLPGDIESGNFAGSNKLITDGAIPVFSGEDILIKYGDIVKEKESECEEKDFNAFPSIGKDSEFSKKKSKYYREKKTLKEKCAPSKGEKAEEKDEKNEKKEKISLEGISKNALIVYNIMSDGVCTLDEIKRASELDISKVLVALTELEMFSLVESDGPNRYLLK